MNTNQKRAFDLCFASAGLLLLSPVFGMLALAVKLSDGGSVLFWQPRVGQDGRLFRIVKFRSMVAKAETKGPSITADGDRRITRFGRFLRKTKLDELPQLWNVWRGEMSLVGPRPEVPKYVATYSPSQRRVLRLKPGITDLATLAFRNEEELLRAAPDAERFYREYCLPHKIKLNLAYAEKANLRQDAWIILQTLGLISPQRRASNSEMALSGRPIGPGPAATPPKHAPGGLSHGRLG